MWYWNGAIERFNTGLDKIMTRQEALPCLPERRRDKRAHFLSMVAIIVYIRTNHDKNSLLGKLARIGTGAVGTWHELNQATPALDVTFNFSFYGSTKQLKELKRYNNLKEWYFWFFEINDILEQKKELNVNIRSR